MVKQKDDPGFTENHNKAPSLDMQVHSTLSVFLPHVALPDLFLAARATRFSASLFSVPVRAASDRTLGSGTLHQKVQAPLSILARRIHTTTPPSWVSRRRRASLPK